MLRSRLTSIGCAMAAVLITTLIAAPAASAAPPAPAWGGPARPAYYLSLGDSLAFGYSEAKALEFATPGTPAYLNVADFSGYTEALASRMGVDATNFSCPEETTTTMIYGQCQGMIDAQELGLPSPSLFQHTAYTGPQLTAATTFLSHYRWWQRGIITLSIGSDDVLPIAGQCLGTLSCPGFATALQQMRTNLATILGALRRAAPLATIVVLVPYNPYGFVDPASNLLAVQVDLSIAGVALVHLDRVANTFTPINITDAEQHCTYVYYGCGGPYTGDVHPTDAGYSLIAQVFELALR